MIELSCLFAAKYACQIYYVSPADGGSGQSKFVMILCLVVSLVQRLIHIMYFQYSVDIAVHLLVVSKTSKLF